MCIWRAQAPEDNHIRTHGGAGQAGDEGQTGGGMVHTQKLPVVQGGGTMARKGRSHESRAEATDTRPSILDFVCLVGSH